MATQQIQITTATGPGKFNPNPCVANAGDDLNFLNSDTVAHWPTAQGQANNAWFKTSIPPGETSDGQIALAPNNPVNQPYTITYVCSLHAGETGTITVNPQL